MENVIVVKSKAFALRIIKLYKWLIEEKHEFVIGRQILKSGTSIGANVREGVYSISKKEFVAKLQISLKEASETAYWLELLVESEIIPQELYATIYPECLELVKILTSIIKSTKKIINY